jgi:hypothetical protein
MTPTRSHRLRPFAVVFAVIASAAAATGINCGGSSLTLDNTPDGSQSSGGGSGSTASGASTSGGSTGSASQSGSAATGASSTGGSTSGTTSTGQSTGGASTGSTTSGTSSTGNTTSGTSSTGRATSGTASSGCIDNILCTVNHHWDPVACMCVPNDAGAPIDSGQGDACATNVLCLVGHWDPIQCKCVPDSADAGPCVSDKGGPCGGFTPRPCVCATGLKCHPNRIPDIPGTCGP